MLQAVHAQHVEAAVFLPVEWLAIGPVVEDSTVSGPARYTLEVLIADGVGADDCAPAHPSDDEFSLARHLSWELCRLLR